jgi:hypothetical protein
MYKYYEDIYKRAEEYKKALLEGPDDVKSKPKKISGLMVKDPMSSVKTLNTDNKQDISQMKSEWSSTLRKK